jgi:hypothetical protein
VYVKLFKREVKMHQKTHQTDTTARSQSHKTSKTAAIIGGGLAGCLIALDLAEEGYNVVVFDKADGLIQGASLSNEGKIHLGYVYSADATFQTAENLIDDALVFRPLMEKWISASDFDDYVTDNFNYIIPQNSKLPFEQIMQHFERVDAYIAAQKNQHNLSYLGSTERPELINHRRSAETDCAWVQTHEKAVWPAGIANAISSCVNNHPKIQVVLGTAIARVESNSEKWRLVFADSKQSLDGPFDIIVNAAWSNRRSIDKASGFPSSDSWFTRFKFGALLENATEVLNGELPLNGTGTTGSFGDSVYYKNDDSLYCSWYPVGMCYASRDESTDFRLQNDHHSERLMRETWAGYATIDSAYKPLAEIEQKFQARLIGDFIVARGQTDIVHQESELHERWGHIPRELARGYWSIDTGKYTSAPRCASQCVAAIIGRK